MKKLLIASVVILFFKIAYAQNLETFTDSRDGEIYKTIKMQDPFKGAEVVWMAENLRYKTNGSKFYDNNPEYKKVLGRLYPWTEAMKACPEGWSLPSETEWEALINHFGGEKYALEKLKSKAGWTSDANGSNESEFNAFPGGHSIDGTFYSFGTEAIFWASTYDNSAWGGISAIELISNEQKSKIWIDRTIKINENELNSVRCLKD